MLVNNIQYDDQYITNLISDMLDAEGKEETEANIRETRSFLLTSTYLADIDKGHNHIGQRFN